MTVPVSKDMDSVPKDGTENCFPYVLEHTHKQTINAQWSMDLAWDDCDLLGSQTMEGLSPDS